MLNLESKAHLCSIMESEEKNHNNLRWTIVPTLLNLESKAQLCSIMESEEKIIIIFIEQLTPVDLHEIHNALSKKGKDNKMTHYKSMSTEQTPGQKL